MLTGQPPFPGGTVLQKLLSHSSDPIPNPADIPSRHTSRPVGHYCGSYGKTAGTTLPTSNCADRGLETKSPFGIGCIYIPIRPGWSRIVDVRCASPRPSVSNVESKAHCPNAPVCRPHLMFDHGRYIARMAIPNDWRSLFPNFAHRQRFRLRMI